MKQKLFQFSFFNPDYADACRGAGIRVNVYYAGIEHGWAGGDREPMGYGGEVLLYYYIPVHADDSVPGPGHSGVGYVSGSRWKYPGVGRLHVGVGPDNRAYSPVEKPAERLFLRGYLGMEVDDNVFCSLGNFSGNSFSRPEWVVKGRHKNPSHQVYNSYFYLRAGERYFVNPITVARDFIRIVSGAQNPWVSNNRANFRALKSVIAHGGNIDAIGEYLIAHVFSEALAVSGILGIRDNEPYILFFNDSRQIIFEHVPAGFTDNIT